MMGSGTALRAGNLQFFVTLQASVRLAIFHHFSSHFPINRLLVSGYRRGYLLMGEGVGGPALEVDHSSAFSA